MTKTLDGKKSILPNIKDEPPLPLELEKLDKKNNIKPVVKKLDAATKDIIATIKSGVYIEDPATPPSPEAKFDIAFAVKAGHEARRVYQEATKGFYNILPSWPALKSERQQELISYAKKFLNTEQVSPEMRLEAKAETEIFYAVLTAFKPYM